MIIKKLLFSTRIALPHGQREDLAMGLVAQNFCGVLSVCF